VTPALRQLIRLTHPGDTRTTNTQARDRLAYRCASQALRSSPRSVRVLRCREFPTFANRDMAETRMYGYIRPLEREASEEDERHRGGGFKSRDLLLSKRLRARSRHAASGAMALLDFH